MGVPEMEAFWQDILQKRKSNTLNSAAKLFSLADKKEVSLSVSSLTFANTNYILSKRTTTEKSREILRRFRVLVKVISLDDKIVDLALNDSSFTDFEDGLQYYTAIESGIKVIITRDLKSFKESIIPVMSPQEYLTSID